MKRAVTFDDWVAQTVPAAAPLAPTRADSPVLIVGAGPAGIATAFELTRAGITFEGCERSAGPGGLWDPVNPWSPAYDNLITNSSVATTHLQAPVPADTQPYCSRQRALTYLQSVAKEAGLSRTFRFGCEVTAVSKNANGSWRVDMCDLASATKTSRDYRAVVVASGNQSSQSAHYPSELFAQARESLPLVLHSAAYRRPEPFQAKRVVVIGMGNSGSEIATELSRHAQTTFISARTPPWIVPLYVLGKPSDEFVVSGKELPAWLELPFYRLLQWWYVGRRLLRSYRRPAYRILDRLPISDRGIVDAMKRGTIQLRGKVTGFSVGHVHFEDRREPVDAAIFATGYRRQIPFLPEALSPFGVQAFEPSFLLFHPRERGICFIPEVVVTQGAWPLFVHQARTVAAYFLAEAKNTAGIKRFDDLRRTPNPDLKAHLFHRADEYHVHPRLYAERLTELREWLTR